MRENITAELNNSSGPPSWILRKLLRSIIEYATTSTKRRDFPKTVNNNNYLPTATTKPPDKCNWFQKIALLPSSMPFIFTIQTKELCKMKLLQYSLSYLKWCLPYYPFSVWWAQYWELVMTAPFWELPKTTSSHPAVWMACLQMINHMHNYSNLLPI